MKQIVGVAEMTVSDNPDDIIVTYALGSCLGIAIHDAEAGVGGIAHVMLPQSSVDPAKAQLRPFMFVDTALPKLFHACYRLGAVKDRIRLTVAGGAHALTGSCVDRFEIGKRNFIVLRKILWKNSVLLHAQDVGGSCSRTMSLSIATGEVSIRSGGAVRTL